MSKGLTEVILDRIHRWLEDPAAVFNETKLRSRGPSPPSHIPPPPAKAFEKLEKAAVSALRLGDVRKAPGP